jgi:hypothetical protein
LLDTPALQHLLRQPPGGVCPVRAAVDDHVENRSFPDMSRIAFSCMEGQFRRRSLPGSSWSSQRLARRSLDLLRRPAVLGWRGTAAVAPRRLPPPARRIDPLYQLPRQRLNHRSLNSRPRSKFVQTVPQLGSARRVRAVVPLPDLERTPQACRRTEKVTEPFLNMG